jgi:mannose-6-phosphate isomerase class I
MTGLAAWRKSSQSLMPALVTAASNGHYGVYPSHTLGADRIGLGFEALAARLAVEKRVVLDGYPGVLWDDLRQRLEGALRLLGVRTAWTNVAEALRPADELERRLAPFLGGDDPLFGTRFTGRLSDFFDPERLHALQADPEADLNMIYGSGAALSGWPGLLVYVDVPKNEIQFRARAGSLLNLGAARPADPKEMYKRCYFVDWVAANQHKAQLLPRLDLIVDEQRPDTPTFMAGADLRAGLGQMSQGVWRVRPWFEPGPWGGQWMKNRIPELVQDVPNYAWSFELIVPENGLVFESDGRRLEVSFDFLMYHDHQAVLGASARRFGFEFPIRFDFLDTFAGGNLSLQCHPRPDYIRRHFGERITQDETYYIFDCQPGAGVYLGFTDEAEPAAFRAALERGQADGSEVPVERFVQRLPAHKHDLFLIPGGTIHCSGINNLVLEISATPYIFTFKMYDWQRLDLEGRPRPLNIPRAFDNLAFERRGSQVRRELVSQPRVLSEQPGERLVHRPTHPQHFYDIERAEFHDTVEVLTKGTCHIMNVVDGQSAIVETADGRRERFNYAETFVVSAAAERYRLINDTGSPVKVIRAYIKPEEQWAPGAVL